MLRLALLASVAGCFTMRVETTSQATTVHLRLGAGCESAAVIEQYEADGYQALAVEDGTVTAHVPAMGGGYSERGGRISDVHDPGDYRILRLRRGARVVRELSLDEIDALPTDADGRAIVGCAG